MCPFLLSVDIYIKEKIQRMEIKVEDKKVTLKYGFRALMMFERITGKTFQGGGLNDCLTLFYCCFVAGDLNTNVTFDSFIEWCDDNPIEVVNFTQWLTNKLQMEGELSKQEDNPKDKKESSKKTKKK